LAREYIYTDDADVASAVSLVCTAGRFFLPRVGISSALPFEDDFDDDPGMTDGSSN
jgi:hypothetical protein